MENLKLPKSRGRVLSDDELRAVWKISNDCGQFGFDIKITYNHRATAERDRFDVFIMVGPGKAHMHDPGGFRKKQTKSYVPDWDRIGGYAIATIVGIGIIRLLGAWFGWW
jgi:hypothetical protein